MTREVSAQSLTQKKCSVCETTKPHTEFHKNRGKPRPDCKNCRRKYRAAWYQRNAEREKQKAKEWLAQNRELKYARRQARRLANIESAKKRERESYIRNQRSKLEYAKQRRDAFTPEERVANSKRTRDARARWRARQHGVKVQEGQLREQVITRDGEICYICGKRLDVNKPRFDPEEVTLDHVISLTCGGSHSFDNLRVCCRRCNIKKGTQDKIKARTLKPAPSNRKQTS